MDGILTMSSSELLLKAIEAALILVTAFVIFFAVKRWLVLLAKRGNFSFLTLTPVRVVLRYGIFILAGCLILSLFGVNVNGILAVFATGLAMIAIGFVAVWSVLSNFLCSFVLIFFKPFSIGDEVEFPVDNIGGKVVDLSLIFTTLRVSETEYYQVPNNMFFQKVFKCRTGKKSDGKNPLRLEKPIV